MATLPPPPMPDLGLRQRAQTAPMTSDAENNLFVSSLGSYGCEAGLPHQRSVRKVEDAPPEVLAFSDVSDANNIRSICKTKVPGWSSLKMEDIKVDQLCEGLSNQLFKCYVSKIEATSGVPCVLFRVFGKDVATLYDKKKEEEIYNLLSSYQIAPRMFAHGDGWRIEEWHFATPLPTTYMKNPSVFAQVASSLGRFHKLSRRHDFPRDILDLPPASIQRVDAWTAEAQQAAANLKDPESSRRLVDLNMTEIAAEAVWLKGFVCEASEKIRGGGLDVVLSHNDSQENNILMTHYGLRFIDFEYSSMDYQAYDLANYMVECMIDYNFNKYPFYKVDLSAFPTLSEQRLFLSIYLSEYLETKVETDDVAVDVLLDRCSRFVLMSHYLWAVWSVIRAPQAPTFNEFDFLHYAQLRWDTYKRDKRNLLANSPEGEQRRASLIQFSPREHEAQQRRAPPPLYSPQVHEAEQRREYFLKEGFPSNLQEQNRTRKTPFVLGGLMAASGVILGMCFAVAMMRASAKYR